MLLYEANRFSSLGESNIDVEARDNYIGEAGAARALIESAQNDYAIFESLIQSDFQEAQLSKEGSVNESAIRAIQEASGVGFIENIKKFLMNMWEKIKGFFKAFWNTLTAVVTRDNKKIVEKFRKPISQKDLSKLKVKYAKSTGKDVSYKFTEFKDTEDVIGKAKALKTDSRGMTSDDIEELKGEKYLTKLYAVKTGISGITAETYRKDIHEYLFEDEDEQTGFSGSEIKEFESVLVGSGKAIEALKKHQKNVDAGFKKVIAKIDSMRKEFETKTKDVDQYSDNVQKGNRIYQAANLAAKAESAVVNNVVSSLLTEAKFGIKQARKVYVRAAGFNPKLVKEDANLMTAIEEASDFTVDEMFEYGAWA